MPGHRSEAEQDYKGIPSRLRRSFQKSFTPVQRKEPSQSNNARGQQGRPPELGGQSGALEAPPADRAGVFEEWRSLPWIE